ncbi:MFS transporter [Liquorilactobacillus satsumensis]|uniref:MFS transporter n=1 Tax=Liquorilactobacillus satsumensis TaxID=259059 RepID=UPI0039E85634
MQTHFFANTFAALRSRNFRYFWTGQCISVMGTWIQRTSQTWLVYQMTKSAFLVGLLAACQFLPLLGLTLIAGTLIDRFPKRTLLLITQWGFLVLGALMTLIVYFKVVQYWQILAIALGMGILQSFDTPTRQSFVVELVGQKDLLNGISLNSSIFNLAKIAGPALAGILMVQFGITWCFFINTVSYLAVIFGLARIENIPAVIQTHKRPQMLRDIMAGIHYVLSHSELKLVATMMLIISTLNFNNNVIIPIYAEEVLHAGSQTYANLLSATGIGSLAAAFIMSYLARYGLNRRLYLVVSFGTMLLQSLMLFVRSFWLASVIMILVGFCNMIFLNQSNASFQVGIPHELRGRIMSVYVLLNQGTTPLGSLYVGAVMDLAAGSWGFPACGLLALFLVSVVLLVQRKIIANWIFPAKAK